MFGFGFSKGEVQLLLHQLRVQPGQRSHPSMAKHFLTSAERLCLITMSEGEPVLTNAEVRRDDGKLEASPRTTAIPLHRNDSCRGRLLLQQELIIMVDRDAGTETECEC